MSISSNALQFELMLLFRHLSHLQRNLASGLAPLDRSAYTLISRIELEGPMSIRQLRVALGLDDSTLNRQTAAAAREGLVERIPDPSGGAARKFALTEAGKARLDAERDAHEAIIEQILSRWTDEQRAAFANDIRSFNTAYEQSLTAVWPRPAAG